MKSFSETLTRLMKTKGLSAKALAEQLGIPRSTLSEWIVGRQPKASEDLIKLSKFFGVSLEYLLTGKTAEEELFIDLSKRLSESFVQIHQGVYRITVEKKESSKE